MSLIRSVSVNLSRRTDRVDLQGDRTALLRVEVRVHDRPVGIPFAVADAVGVAVEPDDGLDGILARFQLVERAREADRPGNRSAAVRLASSP